jgi:apocytochrome f
LQIKTPDPLANKEAHFLKYPIYVGGNRGGGQINPDGSRSNDIVYNASTISKVNKIIRKEKGGYEITIDNASNGHQVIDIVPLGPELIISKGESIKVDHPLTNNPNVGGNIDLLTQNMLLFAPISRRHGEIGRHATLRKQC